MASTSHYQPFDDVVRPFPSLSFFLSLPLVQCSIFQAITILVGRQYNSKHPKPASLVQFKKSWSSYSVPSRMFSKLENGYYKAQRAIHLTLLDKIIKSECCKEISTKPGNIEAQASAIHYVRTRRSWECSAALQLFMCDDQVSARCWAGGSFKLGHVHSFRTLL